MLKLCSTETVADIFFSTHVTSLCADKWNGSWRSVLIYANGAEKYSGRKARFHELHSHEQVRLRPQKRSLVIGDIFPSLEIIGFRALETKAKSTS